MCVCVCVCVCVCMCVCDMQMGMSVRMSSAGLSRVIVIAPRFMVTNKTKVRLKD